MLWLLFHLLLLDVILFCSYCRTSNIPIRYWQFNALEWEPENEPRTSSTNSTESNGLGSYCIVSNVNHISASNSVDEPNCNRIPICYSMLRYTALKLRLMLIITYETGFPYDCELAKNIWPNLTSMRESCTFANIHIYKDPFQVYTARAHCMLVLVLGFEYFRFQWKFITYQITLTFRLLI